MTRQDRFGKASNPTCGQSRCDGRLEHQEGNEGRLARERVGSWGAPCIGCSPQHQPLVCDCFVWAWTSDCAWIFWCGATVEPEEMLRHKWFQHIGGGVKQKEDSLVLVERVRKVDMRRKKPHDNFVANSVLSMQ